MGLCRGPRPTSSLAIVRLGRGDDSFGVGDGFSDRFLEKYVRSGLEGAYCEVGVRVGPGIYRNDIGFHLGERLAIVGEARHVGPGLDDIVAPGDRTAAQAGELVAVEMIIRLGMRHAHVAKADDEDAKFFGHDRSFDGLVNR